MAFDYSSLNTTSAASTASTATAATSASSSADTADRFLKLLVTQMQNQDPLNPMDNAQVTSQMAQINTVNGIAQLNTTVQGLNTQFTQLQALTGASLVGREVWLEGSSLEATADGGGVGAFNLTSAADTVKVEVLSPAGQVIDTVQLGAETAGRHDFTWSKAGVTDMTGLSFRVTAKSGAATVPATALMLDKVDSVGIDGDTLTLALERTGDVPYSKILAVH
jgi:flagellar basal-body rod modification protein FlgD